MLTLLRLRKPHRLFAALVVFCYFWVSATIAFEHHHGLLPEMEGLAQVSDSSVKTASAAPLRTRISEKRTSAQTAHCIACEWQAANVSPALPAFTVAFTPPSASRIITTFPRYLHLSARAMPSRAPPLA